MLDAVIQFSIRNKLIVLILTIFLVIWGVYSFRQLPIDAVPDITNNQVQVITISPSLGAEEVERLITFPIETTMASIAELEEIRSFSRFGLSVVTIVFQEHADIYWARQQVGERLVDVKNQIPSDIGEPSMAPITTGLGEIYQYTITAAPGYEDVYSAQDLRGIQDWIIKRQLLGTKGVADVSSFGGFLKQYEVAVEPAKLRSMNVSLTEVFQALQDNNENTGGAYIEKNQQAYFIRAEGLVRSKEEIAQIPIKMNDFGVPILVKDVADVHYGNAIRYGATTKNGKGEVVSAIVMMLKGANSAEVIENIKTKMDSIRKTLPKGVVVEAFLDRTKLVSKAVHTVQTNLLEGALIVIFVLLLLLGNLRAGLIVASVIPLSLLFAVSLMHVFGVSGNLMSLGAIDFGLIVDGAVIIVEATMHHLAHKRYTTRLSSEEMDAEVFASASKIRASAAFGEIIILIVYLPILAMTGTEGKMFVPMAQTVSFAILGAFVLSLTYVPMMSSVFLPSQFSDTPNFSDRLMHKLAGWYQPIMEKSLHYGKSVLLLSVALFASALFLFTKLGGEFIPTLEEGDFAVETRVLTGSSLEKTIEATTMAETILLREFPEVEQVVSKIGSGEIPTDPMPIEAADLMIILQDSTKWVSASNREELVEKMAEKLSDIPGVVFGFQQPIQMRFNELMTGVRQDVAVKIYGEDLQELSKYAEQIGLLASDVQGVQDLYVEEVTGIPQIVVTYKRDQLAKFALHVKDINTIVQTAFAGTSAGFVYEKEKRFDLVLRLAENKRHDIEEIKNLYIPTMDGTVIPLSQVADVDVVDGPYQIQRDNTRRRIVVACNVRNRDVQSVVEELQQLIADGVVFAPGYTVEYGGQFENLERASQRMAVAVPVALFLILLLLYFTFHSVQQSLLIFSAIPLSAIGGVCALWLRDMPFSISAGVGFITLFGVAVLNGIVLISEFNHLREEGLGVLDRIYMGTKTRLRPVIMTAAVAALGFMPMALSNSSGAEVQKPLATVVIGGLISATILTLVVLPVLYYYVEKWFGSTFSSTNASKQSAIHTSVIMGFFVLLSVPQTSQAQEIPKYSLEQIHELLLENNAQLQIVDQERMQTEWMLRGSANISNTTVQLSYGQINGAQSQDSQINISQTIALPLVYRLQRNIAEQEVGTAENAKTVLAHELEYELQVLVSQLCLAKSKHQLLTEEKEIHTKLWKASKIRVETGESVPVEMYTAESQRMLAEMALQENSLEIRNIQRQIAFLIGQSKQSALVDVDMDTTLWLQKISAVISNIQSSQLQVSHPTLQLMQKEVQLAEATVASWKSHLLPQLTLGYTNQSFMGPNIDIYGNSTTYSPSDRFHSVQFGLNIPILSLPYYRANIHSAQISQDIATSKLSATKTEFTNQLQFVWEQLQTVEANLAYFQSTAIPRARLLREQADISFQMGDVDYLQYMQYIQKYMDVQSEYISVVGQYMQLVLDIQLLHSATNFVQ